MSGVTSLSAINSKSTAVLISDQLRESIIDGSFAPGDQINEAKVAKQLNVSRGPVREALQRLTQEGLLVGKPNRGVFVREFTRHDIAEVYEAREVIECAASEQIVTLDAACRDELADKLIAITDDMIAPLEAEDWGALARVDIRFHQALVDAGENSRLSRAYETLATEALICLRQFADAYPSPERVIPGHHLIAEQLRRGDMREVHLILHQHLTLDDFELHSHDEHEQLRHGRDEHTPMP